MKFTKSHLIYQDEYSWSVTYDNFCEKKHNAANKVFNKKNGDDVLSLINSFNFKCLDSFNKAELMIRNHLPENYQHYIHIKKWLCTNWININPNY